MSPAPSNQSASVGHSTSHERTVGDEPPAQLTQPDHALKRPCAGSGAPCARRGAASACSTKPPPAARRTRPAVPIVRYGASSESSTGAPRGVVSALLMPPHRATPSLCKRGRKQLGDELYGYTTAKGSVRLPIRSVRYRRAGTRGSHGRLAVVRPAGVRLAASRQPPMLNEADVRGCVYSVLAARQAPIEALALIGAASDTP